ncbi:MAG: pilus assembly protein TadG-related protein, partial [Novosphingobium sp.]
MGRDGRSLLTDERGAVAATYALALAALIAIAGVSFDYARLATMDTELQNAADQAALAAATQLDGQGDSITRATSAAGTLVSNSTLLANDGAGTAAAVDALNIRFYATRAHAEAETPETTDPLQAHFVRVGIVAREAFYAFTPIVGALSSGDVNARATAGLGSAICKTPPVMMCNPATNSSVADIPSLVGKGVLLKANGSNSWAPGDFGFLD